ncbi:unnamed protein product [Haemonchus placei]|uniref:Rhodanese domain-containing protein n=1 Tax=Haemonchus placei TaxID=6290 RepID=A0A0N4VTN4_HAEPC|nr:unnamed protein product [Haemonchus placei]
MSIFHTVTPEWLAQHMPRAYVEEHIPGAVLFNIDAAFYPSKYIRFDLYPPEVFERYMRLLGVNNDDHVYGHGKVSVLDGGLDAWKKAGYPVTNQVVQRRVRSSKHWTELNMWV